MKRILVAVLVPLLVNTSQAQEPLLDGRVVSVADGDTVTLLDAGRRRHKIRLAGIDAPEKGQPFGKQAKANLSLLVYGRQVHAECSKQDRYKRHVCKVVGNGVDVNLEQVRQGYAWHYKKYQNEQFPEDRLTYQEAEAFARLERRGLWAVSGAVAPWEWRKLNARSTGLK